MMMIIIIMSKILCLNIVHLNTHYQRTMESSEKCFAIFVFYLIPHLFLPDSWSRWCGPHNTHNISVWPGILNFHLNVTWSRLCSHHPAQMITSARRVNYSSTNRAIKISDFDIKIFISNCYTCGRHQWPINSILNRDPKRTQFSLSDIRQITRLHCARLDDIVITCMQLYTHKNLVLPSINKGEFDMRSISQLGFVPCNPSIEWLEYTFNTSINFVWEKNHV